MSIQGPLLESVDPHNDLSHNNNNVPIIIDKKCNLSMVLKVFVIILFLSSTLFLQFFRTKDPISTLQYTYVLCNLNITSGECTSSYELQTSSIEPTLISPKVIIARAIYDPILNQTGWNTLTIDSYGPANDQQQLNAVGFIEGYLTYEQITNVLLNSNSTQWKGKPDDAYDKLVEWFEIQESYHQFQINANAHNPKVAKSTRQYWEAVELTLAQHHGLKAGYEQRLQSLSLPIEFDLNFWAKRPDFGDTLNTIYQNTTKNCWDMSIDELDILMGEEHCSSISKTIIDLSNHVICRPINNNNNNNNNINNHNNNNKNDVHFQQQSSSTLQTKTIQISDNVECDVNFVLDFAVLHDTWTSFVDMVRIVKKYTLDLNLYRETHPKPKSIYINDNDDDEEEEEEKFIISMTGYPGMLTSYDDYYVLPAKSQQLIITETTNTNCNKELWLKNSVRSVPTSHRTFIASLLAVNGYDWANIYSNENSGTYNNQWMIIDTKLWNSSYIDYIIEPYPNHIEQLKKIKKVTTFTNGNQLFFSQITQTHYPPKFYYIAEQAPGFVKIKDVTRNVNNATRWLSYNRPFTSDVYNAMGFDKATEILGDYYSYTDYARAQIMIRDNQIKTAPSQLSTTATTITNNNHLSTYPIQNTTSSYDLMRYMRFNDYQNDPLSLQCPSYVVAARNDLTPDDGCGSPLTKPVPRGQTDVKMGTVNTIRGDFINWYEHNLYNPIFTNRIDIIDWDHNANIHTPYTKTINQQQNQNALYYIIAGPTTEQQQPFTWNNLRWENFTHYGHPSRFDFDWIQLNH